MKILIPLAVIGILGAPSMSLAQSPFEGTWRPDPQRPDPGRKPDVIQLINGEYDCQSCTPPYKVKADGMDHSLSGNPRFDALRITVVDDRTITKVARKAGKPVVESRVEVSADGRTLTERQILSDAGPRKIDFTSHSSRVAEAPQGSHHISGSWHLIDADLTHHDEDTDYHIAGNALTMSDRMGRSFTAKLDGTDAPYQGDPEVTSVSVKQLDAHTIEESDKNAGKVVKIIRWSVDPDGKTMHVRFDDGHGHVQQQTGHKLK
jgi:hypothetical protein